MPQDKSYKSLIVWQKSIDLVEHLYALTDSFPEREKYGIASQMRRAAVSIPSNIAEGSRRRGKDIRHFLVIAFGSASELDTQLIIAKRLKYGAEKEYDIVEGLLEEILKMLNTMINK